MEVDLITNLSGFYLASELAPGTYSVQVEAPGFASLDITKVTVTAGTTTTVDAHLKVGATSQKVEVTLIRKDPILSSRSFPDSNAPKLRAKSPT